MTTQMPESLRRMSALVSPYGLVSRVTRLPVADGEADFPVFTASIGHPGHVLAEQTDWVYDPLSGNFDGAGGDLNPERAAHLAIAESLERYSSCARDSDRTVWATARSLGDDAVALDVWPRCSATELADPGNGLTAPDRDAPMRWVRGWSFTRRRPVWVPSVHVWLKNQPESAGERLTHTVSTGCAAHSDPAAAVVNGLLEVVERDSIALTWLQRLRLPRLEFQPADLTPEVRAFVARASVEHVRTLLFDATTDLGVPVIYGVQLSDADPVIAQLVAATCDLDPQRAVAKLYREAASLRIALRTMATAAARRSTGGTATGHADRQDNVGSVIEGALRLGPRAQRHHFDFLLAGERPVRRLDALPTPPSTAPRDALAWLLDRLHRAGCEVVVVDLTTAEAERVGAVVVRVLVPQLMPLSFVHKARYLEHPRLYQAPKRMGHPVHPESAINPIVQPFA